MTNSIDYSIITGHLLGDGSIINPEAKRKKSCLFTHTSVHKEYIEWITANTPGLTNRPIWKKVYLDPRNNKTYVSYWLRSFASKEYTELRALWYPNGKKELPDIKLDAVSLLRWFLDDGSLASKGGIYLATDGFSIISVDKLISLLEDLGLYFSKHLNDGKYRLYLPKKQVYKFYQIIGKCPVECFNYKWKS